MWRSSFVEYTPTSGLTYPLALIDIARGCAPCSADSTSDESVHIAVASSETSTTLPLPGAGALEQRGRHAERQRHRTVAVTHRAALADGPVELGGREHVRQATARPERRRVVARRVGVGTAGAVAVAARVDQRAGTAR